VADIPDKSLQVCRPRTTAIRHPIRVELLRNVRALLRLVDRYKKILHCCHFLDFGVKIIIYSTFHLPDLIKRDLHVE
jgi:hypothetical protein